MVMCEDCQLDMGVADGCTADALILNDRRYPRYPVRSYRGSRRCGDCNAAVGRYHHLGCDIELCPRCRGQLLSCGCGLAADDEDTESVLAVVGDTVVYPAALRRMRVGPDPAKPWG